MSNIDKQIEAVSTNLDEKINSILSNSFHIEITELIPNIKSLCHVELESILENLINKYLKNIKFLTYYYNTFNPYTPH